jgi:hypothetical protein
MLKKFLLKIFHKKHKFTSKTTFVNVNSISCGDISSYSSDMIKRETLTCKICGHVKIIDRLAIRIHQGNITEPLGTITTKNLN